MGVKKIKSNRNRILITVLAAFLTLVLISWKISNKKLSNSSSSPVSVTLENDEQETPISVLYQQAEDGAYKNFKYGYRLKYPENLFVKSELAGTNSADFYTSENLSTLDKGEIEKHPKDIFLSIKSLQDNDLGYKEAEDYLNQSIKYRNRVGTRNTLYNVLFKNFRVTEENGKRIAINYQGPDLYTENNFQGLDIFEELKTAYPNEYSLTAIYLTDEFGIYVNMSSASKSLIDSNLGLFEKLVNSVEILDLQTPSS